MHHLLCMLCVYYRVKHSNLTMLILSIYRTKTIILCYKWCAGNQKFGQEFAELSKIFLGFIHFEIKKFYYFSLLMLFQARNSLKAFRQIFFVIFNSRKYTIYKIVNLLKQNHLINRSDLHFQILCVF